MLINYIKTLQSITLIPKKGKPVVVQSDDVNFKTISKLVSSGKLQEALEHIDVKECVKTSNSRFKLDEKTGTIVIDGQSLPNSLSNRILNFSKSKLDTKPLENFWNNLKKNPTKSSIDSLYDFIEVNHVPITEDGHFICYKRVRSDFKDMYKGEYDNTPGRIVEMPREMVDPVRGNTCSQGLHVAAFKYAHSDYGNGEGHLLEVKVNPRDVVAVPPDYDNQKMRVCKYKVIKICGGKELNTQTYDAPVKKNKKNQKKNKIIRIPADQKDLSSDGRHDVNIPNSLLGLIGLELGDDVHVFVADKRSRCVTISAKRPKRFTIHVSTKVSRTSLKIRSSTFKKAKISGSRWYTVSASHGNLEVKI